jgi:hypothetical protein
MAQTPITAAITDPRKRKLIFGAQVRQQLTNAAGILHVELFPLMVIEYAVYANLYTGWLYRRPQRQEWGYVRSVPSM